MALHILCWFHLSTVTGLNKYFTFALELSSNSVSDCAKLAGSDRDRFWLIRGCCMGFFDWCEAVMIRDTNRESWLNLIGCIATGLPRSSHIIYVARVASPLMMKMSAQVNHVTVSAVSCLLIWVAVRPSKVTKIKSPKRPLLLEPSPVWKCLLALSHWRHS